MVVYCLCFMFCSVRLTADGGEALYSAAGNPGGSGQPDTKCPGQFFTSSAATAARRLSAA